MSKTIRRIAEELNITKQAVYQRMESIDNFREDHTKMIGNRIMVDESGEKLIVNFEKFDKYNQQEQQQEDNQERKEDQFDTLIHQLSVKDSQIKELQDELSKQQQLELDILGENKELRERINQLEKNDSAAGKKHRKRWKLWVK